MGGGPITQWDNSLLLSIETPIIINFWEIFRHWIFPNELFEQKSELNQVLISDINVNFSLVTTL